jgi:hypothetical protein
MLKPKKSPVRHYPHESLSVHYWRWDNLKGAETWIKKAKELARMYPPPRS